MANDIIHKLSPTMQQNFADIAAGRVLGASNHINMILDMMLDLAVNSDCPELEKQQAVKDLASYFIATRGKSSYAIVNALARVERLIFTSDDPPAPFEKQVAQAVTQFKQQSQKDLETILTLTSRVLDTAQTVMLYDYSSTVEKAVANHQTPLTVIIPESRAIDGGRPFVPPLLNTRHQLHFIPDAALGTVLRSVDCVLIGAETYYPDGTAFNTVGAEMLAELCCSRKISYYVLTPTLKCDPRSVQGIYKPVIGADLRNKLAAHWNFDADTVDFYTQELVAIPPAHITAYITEQGIIPANQLFDLERRH